MPLTLRQMLDNYRARYGHMLTASKISEPWVRVKLWADRVRDASTEIAGYWRGEAPDVLVDELHDCLREWRRELAAIQSHVDLAVAIREHSRNTVLTQHEAA